MSTLDGTKLHIKPLDNGAASEDTAPITTTITIKSPLTVRTVSLFGSGLAMGGLSLFWGWDRRSPP